MEGHASRPVRYRLWAIFGIFGILATATPASPAFGAEPVEVTFSYTGSEQTFDVPGNVTTIHVGLIGGKGGDLVDFTLIREGGRGARIEADLAVDPGMTLYVEVGGSNGPGFNGGGDGFTSGGGASDIRGISRTAAGSLDSRLIVAAGGGGAALDSAGGDAGQQGQGAVSGGAGSATAGGSGGLGEFPGAAGTFGAGGTGGREDQFNSFVGAGGGGGHYGGGGGGGTNEPLQSGAGGGGSSYTGTATNASVTLDASGVSSITISYEAPPPDTGVVDADVSVPTSAACIELSTTSVTFGTQLLGGQNLAASPAGIEVTNCSGSDQTLMARGTNATGDGATWQLVNDAGTCGAGTLATDDYHLKLRFAAAPDVVVPLSTNNAPLQQELAGGDTTFFEPLIDMPCPGSSGSGQTMGMQIVFVVTE